MKLFGLNISSNKLKKYRKTCWKPQVVDGDGELDASKYSGLPWLSADEDWPNCGNCQQPMQLFLQLNLDHLPDVIQNKFGSGLLQLFYCTNREKMCEDECEAFFPFSRSVLVRVILPENRKPGIDLPALEDYFPEKQIVGWKAIDDYPHQEELFELGEDVDDSDLEKKSVQKGDKLAGWPAWVQNVEYPKCPECGEKMQLVFQIDSEDNIPYMFGDSGCGHITQCPNHKNKVAFSWACY